MVTLLIIDVQVWWSRFAWRKLANWTFETFIAMLLVPIGAYVLSALVVAEPAELPIDLRREYFTRRQVFFGVLIAAIAASYLPDVIATGRLGNAADVAAKAVMIAIVVPALFTQSERYHKVLALAGLLVFCGYIALLFERI
jgi:FtsH-binding integral membrane protein